MEDRFSHTRPSQPPEGQGRRPVERPAGQARGSGDHPPYDGIRGAFTAPYAGPHRRPLDFVREPGSSGAASPGFPPLVFSRTPGEEVFPSGGGLFGLRPPEPSPLGRQGTGASSPADWLASQSQFSEGSAFVSADSPPSAPASFLGGRDQVSVVGSSLHEGLDAIHLDTPEHELLPFVSTLNGSRREVTFQRHAGSKLLDEESRDWLDAHLQAYRQALYQAMTLTGFTKTGRDLYREWHQLATWRLEDYETRIRVREQERSQWQTHNQTIQNQIDASESVIGALESQKGLAFSDTQIDAKIRERKGLQKQLKTSRISQQRIQEATQEILALRENQADWEALRDTLISQNTQEALRDTLISQNTQEALRDTLVSQNTQEAPAPSRRTRHSELNELLRGLHGNQWTRYTITARWLAFREATHVPDDSPYTYLSRIVKERTDTSLYHFLRSDKRTTRRKLNERKIDRKRDDATKKLVGISRKTLRKYVRELEKEARQAGDATFTRGSIEQFAREYHQETGRTLPDIKKSASRDDVSFLSRYKQEREQFQAKQAAQKPDAAAPAPPEPPHDDAPVSTEGEESESA